MSCRRLIFLVFISILGATAVRAQTLQPPRVVLLSNASDEDPLRASITDLFRRHKLPAIYEPKSFVRRGGLLSYGADLMDAYAIAGSYAGRILKGETAAVLPVTQPTKIELSINLRTAKELAIDIPIPILARADEVVE